jgi:hypothetical protein
MKDNTEVSADYNYLYRNGQKFFPVIQESPFEWQTVDVANTVLIRLPAKSDDELIWEKERSYTEKAISDGKMILWELDFGLSSQKIDVLDSSLFYSFGIAVDEFVNTLWREHKDSTLGVVLYRGDINFANKFLWNEEHREYFIEKVSASEKKEFFTSLATQENWVELLKEEKTFTLFAADIFAQYFQRLVSYLPDTAMAFALFDASEATSASFVAQLFSKERFQHILLGLKKSPIPAGHLNWEEGACFGGWIGINPPYFSTVSEVSLGICLPSEEVFSDEVSEELNELFEECSRFQLAFRIIPESQLTEAWDGIDDIIVISSTVSYQGKRRLQGFCAAGGRVVCLGESLQLPSEISYEEYLLEVSVEEALV